MAQDTSPQLVAIAAGKGRLQRQEFVERHAEPVNVRSRVGGAVTAAKLLRAHVTQRADQVTGVSQVELVLGQSRQSKVGHPEAAPAIDQQIRRLDVAMDDSDLMCVIERICRLSGPPYGRLALAPHRIR